MERSSSALKNMWTDGRLEEEEIEYKFRVSVNVTAARDAMLAGAADWPEQLKKALNTNFIRWGVNYDFHRGAFGIKTMLD